MMHCFPVYKRRFNHVRRRTTADVVQNNTFKRFLAAARHLTFKPLTCESNCLSTKQISNKMSYSVPGTPRNFITPKKSRNGQTPREKCNFVHPTTPSQKSQFITPKRFPKQFTDTPECYSSVTLETPNSAAKRRSSKEKFDELSNLTVAVRVRPMNTRELACVGATNVVQVRDEELVVKTSLASNISMSFDHVFQYDHIFWSVDENHEIYSSQEDVFEAIGKPLLKNAFRGYNACLFAYGQTGSGKSFSMMGRNTLDAVDIDSEEFSGITPRFCRDLFYQINNLNEDCSVTVEVSYFEIYNEKIHDLLGSHTSSNRVALKVREHPIWGPYVVNLSTHNVKSYEELRDWLLLGNKNRATAATSMNEKSSRSHSIFSIEICLSESLSDTDSSRRSRVSLIDLAGSERLGNSHNSEEQIRQGVSINKSLLTLGKVISALADQRKNQYVPYRDSVLTWLLRESLGGNSLTSMLATITPASSNVEETLSTLRYACQARSIVNRARINENPHDRLIRELRTEVERLRALRQNYERNSLSSSTSSIIQINDSDYTEELDELRTKLSETESKLQEAERSWQQRFMETKETQLKELAEAEKYREELESHVRIMKTADTNVKLSPFRSNFLEELEGALEENIEICESDALLNIKNWCCRNGITCTFTSDTFKLVDPVNKKQAIVVLSSVNNLNGFENVCDFIRNLTWTDIKSTKKLSKKEVMSKMNQIYQALGGLQPDESENHLNLLFAKVNKSLQSFEAALLNNVKSGTQKTVTFNM